jgi:hypothetical protein
MLGETSRQVTPADSARSADILVRRASRPVPSGQECPRSNQPCGRKHFNASAPYIAIVENVRKLRRFLWMNCYAKRLECAELAPALVRPRPSESASKLDALQTLRAVRLRLGRAAFLRTGMSALLHVGSLCGPTAPRNSGSVRPSATLRSRCSSSSFVRLSRLSSMRRNASHSCRRPAGMASARRKVSIYKVPGLS